VDNASREGTVGVPNGQRNRRVVEERSDTDFDGSFPGIDALLGRVHGRRNPVLGARRSIGVATVSGTVRRRREQHFEGQDGDGDGRSEESSAPEQGKIDVDLKIRSAYVRDADPRCTMRLGAPVDEALLPVDYRSRDERGTVSALSLGPIVLPRKRAPDVAKIDRAGHSDVRKLE
jgi:hypothetical protein